MLGGGGNGAGGRGAEGRGHGNLEVSRVGGHRRARRDAPPHRWLDTTPSRRAIGTTYDRAQIRTNPTPGSSEQMSGFRDPRREPQDRARPAGWQSCLGRLPKPPENAKIAFRWGWHKLEMPQPLRRPAQTRQAPPERASSIGEHQCWLDTTPPEGRSERHATAPRSVQRLPGLA